MVGFVVAESPVDAGSAIRQTYFIILMITLMKNMIQLPESLKLSGKFFL